MCFIDFEWKDDVMTEFGAVLCDRNWNLLDRVYWTYLDKEKIFGFLSKLQTNVTFIFKNHQSDMAHFAKWGVLLHGNVVNVDSCHQQFEYNGEEVHHIPLYHGNTALWAAHAKFLLINHQPMLECYFVYTVAKQAWAGRINGLVDYKDMNCVHNSDLRGMRGDCL